MNIFSAVFLVSIFGAIFGFKKPWMGAIPGVITAAGLCYANMALPVFALMTSTLFLLILGTAYGFISSVIISGLKGQGERIGQAYMSGFGVHHPGGIILSNEELKTLADKNIRAW